MSATLPPSSFESLARAVKYKAGQLVRLKTGDVGALELGQLATVTPLNHSSDLLQEELAGVDLNVLKDREWYVVLKVEDESALSDPDIRTAISNRLLAPGDCKVIIVTDNAMTLACHHCLKCNPAAVLQFCSKCRVAPYCSKTCQCQDWQRHKRRECFELNDFRSMSKMPLYHAVTNGDLESVLRLLRNGANVNKHCASGQSALMRASINGDISIIECLVQHKADPNQANAAGVTPLIFSCRKGSIDVVESLVKHNADVNMECANCESPLTAALLNGHLAVAQWLVQQTYQLVDLNSRDKVQTGYTPLLRAVYIDSLPSVKFLVENGANINLRSNDGKTALIFAAGKGCVDIVKYLIGQGAVFTGAQSTMGDWEPVHIAVENDRVDVLRYLLHCSVYVDVATMTNNTTALMLAVTLENLPIVQLLIEHGAGVNAVDKAGWASIHHAACKTSLPVVQYLVEHKADLGRRDKAGNSLRDIAARSSNPDIAAYLRSQRTYMK